MVDETSIRVSDPNLSAKINVMVGPKIAPKLLPAAMNLAAAGAYILALIKPQFEVGRGMVGKGGIVRDTAVHDAVVADIENWLITEMKWQHLGTTPSLIEGSDGNREFLLAGCKS